VVFDVSFCWDYDECWPSEGDTTQPYRNCSVCFSISHLKDEGRNSIWNVGKFLPDYTASPYKTCPATFIVDDGGIVSVSEEANFVNFVIYLDRINLGSCWWFAHILQFALVELPPLRPRNKPGHWCVRDHRTVISSCS
jgi:hypothetical protein